MAVGTTHINKGVSEPRFEPILDPRWPLLITFPGYTFPNDEKEQDHMDILGHMFTLILSGKLFLAPIGENPQRILDLGTGTGLWAVDMGQSIPKHRTCKLFD
jgi:hypothetical protein